MKPKSTTDESTNQVRLSALHRKLNAKEKTRFKRRFRLQKRNAEQELRPLIEELTQVINRSYVYKIDAVINCARMLIEQQLEQDAFAIIPITEKVLKNVAEHTDVEVAFNPTDAATVANALLEIPSAHAQRRNFVIISDETIKRGSLIVKAHKSIIDANLKTQLDRAFSILLT